MTPPAKPSRVKQTLQKAAPAVTARPVFSFLDRWINADHNRLVLSRGGAVFADLLLHMQREQAGRRDLSPDKLEAYYDIIELLNSIEQQFPAS